MNQQFDEILNKVVELKDRGLKDSEILNLLSGDQALAREILGLFSVLSDQKNNLTPPRELLSEILKNMPAPAVSVSRQPENSRWFWLGLKFLAPAAVIATLALALTRSNDFDFINTNKQPVFSASETKELALEQQDISQANIDLDEYFSEETALAEVDEALAKL